MLAYWIDRFDVVEVAAHGDENSEPDREEVVFHGIDEGSALAVGRALAAYAGVPLEVCPRPAPAWERRRPIAA